jgi:GNAT superfamily N-acetyltransferase
LNSRSSPEAAGAAVELRLVAPGEFDQWLPLWQGYQAFYGIELDEPTTRTTWARIIDESEVVFGAMAWQAGQAVGLAHWLFHRSTWSVSNDCYLNDLFVAPPQRRLGVARRLIDFAAQAARSAGCGQMYWLTHETNASAIGLYRQIAERTGFLDFRIRL